MTYYEQFSNKAVGYLYAAIDAVTTTVLIYCCSSVSQYIGQGCTNCWCD